MVAVEGWRMLCQARGGSGCSVGRAGGASGAWRGEAAFGGEQSGVSCRQEVEVGGFSREPIDGASGCPAGRGPTSECERGAGAGVHQMV